MTAAVEAVVFDIGGVLVDWNPRHLYRKLFDDGDAMENFLHRVCSMTWHAETDRGRPMAEGVAELCREHPQWAPYIEAYHHRWDEMFNGPIEGTVAVMSELRDRHMPLYALTNFPGEKFAAFRASFGFVDGFEGIMVSGDEGIIKPEEEIFHRLLKRFALSAETTMFIDDMPANVAAAQELGFQAHRFTSPDRLRQALRNQGLL